MALIAEKFPFTGQTGQCLVLESREKLIYPFSLGDYSEIRFGMYFSFTSGSNTNTVVSASDLASVSSPLNQIFIGFCNYATGSQLPGQTNGYDYVGLYGYGAGGTCGINISEPYVYLRGGASAGSADNALVGITDITGGRSTVTTSNGIDPAYRCPTIATGATTYAGAAGMQFVLSGTNAFRFRTFTNASTFTSDVSTTNLRSFINSMPNLTIATGFFTSGQANTPNKMMTPNAILIYMPMLNTRLRIHNLVVERYA